MTDTRSDYQSILMDLESVERCQNQLYGLCEEAEALRSGDGILPDMIIHGIKECAEACLAARNRLLERESPFTLSGGISAIRREIEEKLAVLDMNRHRDTVSSYLRLAYALKKQVALMNAADLEKRVSELEDSKLELCEWCRTVDGNVDDGLRPYEIVLSFLSDSEDYFRDEYLEFLQITLPLKLIMHLQRDKPAYYIDLNADLSRYLDGSCPMLEPLGKQPQTTGGVIEEVAVEVSCGPFKSDVGDSSGFSEPLPSPSVEEMAFTPQIEDPEAEAVPVSSMLENLSDRPEEQFPGYHGYRRNVELITKDSTNSSDFQPKKFLSECDKARVGKQICLSALQIVQKLVFLPRDVLDNRHNVFPAQSVFDLLMRKGYLGAGELRVDGRVHAGYVLSKKGSAAFARESLIAQMRRLKRAICPVGRFGDNRTCTLTISQLHVVNILAFAHALSEQNELLNVRIIAPGAVEELVSALVYTGTRGAFVVISSLLIPGEEQQVFNAIKSKIDSLAPANAACLVILIDAREDAPILAQSLGITEDVMFPVYFACRETPLTWFDLNGDDTKPAKTEEKQEIPLLVEDNTDDTIEIAPAFDGNEASEDMPITQADQNLESALEGGADAPMNEQVDPPEALSETCNAQTETGSGIELKAKTSGIDEDACFTPSSTQSINSEPTEKTPMTSVGIQIDAVIDSCAFTASGEDDTMFSVQPTVVHPVDEYREIAFEAIADKQIAAGLVMLRALEEVSPEDDLYPRFALAVDAPETRPACYRPSHVQQVYALPQGEALGYDALALCSHLRMFFSLDILTEPYNLNEKRFEGNLIFKRLAMLKHACYELEQAFSGDMHCLDEAMLSRLIDGDMRAKNLEELRKRSEQLLSTPMENTTAMANRVIETRKMLLGRQSDMTAVLTCVRDNDQTRLPFVERLLDGFRAQDSESGTEISIQRINDYIDEKWEATDGRGVGLHRDPIKVSLKNNTRRKILEILELAANWVSLNDSLDRYAIPEQVLGRYATLRMSLLEKFHAARESILSLIALDLADRAALFTLSFTLEDLCRRLESGENPFRRKHFYIELLRSNRIELSQDALPHIEAESVWPLDLCRRIAEHIHAEKETWEQVIQRIFNGDELQGRDYGSAALVKEYLEAVDIGTTWPENCDVDRCLPAAISRMTIREADFSARLEMAQNYGWIEDEALVRHIETEIAFRRQRCSETNNFGFYFRFMVDCIGHIQEDAARHKDKYLRRLSTLVTNRGETELTREVARLIEQQMYTVAQDYIQQAERENRTEAPQSCSLADRSGCFEQFIDGYDRYYTGATRAAHTSFSDVYGRWHTGKTNSNITSGRELLDNWPRSNGKMLPKLKAIFNAMDMPIRDVQPSGDARYLITFLSMERAYDYTHPIGAFGTGLRENGLIVVVLFGNKNADQMNSEIKKIMTASVTHATLFLVDTALSLPDRRRLAARVKRENQNLTPYLVLDRTLVLFLADQNKQQRWETLLRCALPFQYLNPYVEGSNALIYPEMFIGRRGELNSVVDINGANLIYGGRQLGKTALLHRAETLEHDPTVGKWAVFLDAVLLDEAKTLAMVDQRLTDVDFYEGSEAPVDSWDVLARKITQCITRSDGRIKKLLLLIDEADTFLASCENMRYAPIIALKRIQVDTGNRFKFVLAGLHNVLRFSRKASLDNSAIPHLGAITIRPLPFHEASELLEMPLSFLGFRMQPEQIALIAQILSACNYYPGLIQFYASRLIKSLCSDVAMALDRPPYLLDEGRILSLLRDTDFSKEIRDKYLITLGLASDEGYYNTIAHVLCYLDYNSEILSSEGYTPAEVLETCQAYHFRGLRGMTIEQITVLMNELVDLNIFRSFAGGEGEMRYTFNRASFRHMLGSPEEIDDKLNAMMEG